MIDETYFDGKFSQYTFFQAFIQDFQALLAYLNLTSWYVQKPDFSYFRSFKIN